MITYSFNWDSNQRIATHDRHLKANSASTKDLFSFKIQVMVSKIYLMLCIVRPTVLNSIRLFTFSSVLKAELYFLTYGNLLSLSTLISVYAWHDKDILCRHFTRDSCVLSTHTWWHTRLPMPSYPIMPYTSLYCPSPFRICDLKGINASGFLARVPDAKLSVWSETEANTTYRRQYRREM